MATPIAGVPTSAASIAQQKLQDQGSQQLQKQGASKFDGVMAQKTQGVDPTSKVQQAQQVSQIQKTQHVAQVQDVNKADKVALNKVNGNVDQKATVKGVDPVAAKGEASKVTGMMSKMIGDIEKGQGVMDTLINGGLSGKNFSSSELLALQAGMYKYTQELELTGKVVEKATTGLKDTLKTQV